MPSHFTTDGFVASGIRGELNNASGPTLPRTPLRSRSTLEPSRTTAFLLDTGLHNRTPEDGFRPENPQLCQFNSRRLNLQPHGAPYS